MEKEFDVISRSFFLGIYIPIDTYIRFLERGRECGVPEKACFLGCSAMLLD